mgnify:FL=1
MGFFKDEKLKWCNIISVSIMIALLILVIAIAIFHEPKAPLTNTINNTVIKEYYPLEIPQSTYVYNNYYEVVGNDTTCNAYALDSGRGVVLACQVKT